MGCSETKVELSARQLHLKKIDVNKTPEDMGFKAAAE